MKQLNPIIDIDAEDCFAIEVYAAEKPDTHYMIAVDANTVIGAISKVRAQGWSVVFKAGDVQVQHLINAGERSLLRWKDGTAGSFERQLWELLSIADSYNFLCLKRGFPAEAAAFIKYIHDPLYLQDVVERANNGRFDDEMGT